LWYFYFRTYENLYQKIEDGVAAVIIAQLLFLEAENPEKPISLYINSPGGSVTAGMAIYDTVSIFLDFQSNYIYQISDILLYD